MWLYKGHQSSRVEFSIDGLYMAYNFINIDFANVFNRATTVQLTLFYHNSPIPLVLGLTLSVLCLEL